MKKITIKNIDINVTGIGDDDFVSLTYISKKSPTAIIKLMGTSIGGGWIAIITFSRNKCKNKSLYPFI